MGISYIPEDATNVELFAIKNEEAFIGFNLPNGNFEFIQVKVCKELNNITFNYDQLKTAFDKLLELKSS